MSTRLIPPEISRPLFPDILLFTAALAVDLTGFSDAWDPNGKALKKAMVLG